MHENANLKMKTKDSCRDFKNWKLGQGEDGVGRGKAELGSQYVTQYYFLGRRTPHRQGHSVMSLCDPWTLAHQAPLSMEFSRQEYWSGLPFPFPGDLPSPWIEPRSLALQVYSLPVEPQGKPKKYGNSWPIKKRFE